MSYIITDYQILSAIMPVRLVRWKNPSALLQLIPSVLQSEVVFVWFARGPASTTAFVLSRIFRKKIVVVAGGSEVSPAIQRSGIRSAIGFLLTRIILNNSDLVIAVSHFNKREIFAVSRPKDIRVVYLGIDTNKFRPGPSKSLDVLTVAAGTGRFQFLRKGLDRFAELANRLPARGFIAVGELASTREYKQCFGKNVRLTGSVSNNVLISYFQRTRFYCQLSRHEQFGVAVAEAMATECVPVVSDRGALPEVVGNCGIIVRGGDPIVASEAIEESWGHCERLGRLARERVQAHYSVEKRIVCFKEIFSELLPNRF
jgi:glycosyltransferase involved in cell wall biosynthesis